MVNPNPGSQWQDHSLYTRGRTLYPLSYCGKYQDVIQVTLDFFLSTTLVDQWWQFTEEVVSCRVWIVYTEVGSVGRTGRGFSGVHGSRRLAPSDNS